MMLRSLRLRLLLGAGVAILAALVAAWYAMTLLFVAHLNAREDEVLGRQALQLIAGLHLDGQGAPVADTPPSDPRLQRPSGGLYWQVRAPGGAARSRSLWDQDLPPPLAATDHAWHRRDTAGPFEARVAMIERHLLLAGNRPVVVQMAEDAASLAAARQEFGRTLLLFLAVLWLALTMAAAVQVELGLRPLARLRRSLKAMRTNPAERLPVGDHPPEVAPLLLAINQLADAREQDVARARRRAADLAHGLKTPLAVLMAQSRKVRDGGGEAVAENLDKAIAAAGAAVEAELARARAALARESATTAKAPVRAGAERVVQVVERTEAGAALVFEIESPADLHLPLSVEELAEILGALTENAARFARRRVRIVAGAGLLCVEDDGPGLADGQVQEALARGGRLDESGPGHGFGLAIARDLVEARGGNLTLSRSGLGGLKVEMTWPSAFA
jgi:signal transduction histidine kinase